MNKLDYSVLGRVVTIGGGGLRLRQVAIKVRTLDLN